jgi:uncharacterized DUF497 family protein
MMIGFEWDEEKNDENILKHGLAFEDAALVFGDFQCAVVYDEEHSSIFEERWKAYGFVNRVLVVSFTERNGKIRIISARRATVLEEEEYCNGYCQSIDEPLG